MIVIAAKSLGPHSGDEMEENQIDWKSWAKPVGLAIGLLYLPTVFVLLWSQTNIGWQLLAWPGVSIVVLVDLLDGPFDLLEKVPEPLVIIGYAIMIVSLLFALTIFSKRGKPWLVGAIVLGGLIGISAAYVAWFVMSLP